jgi:hypothetical protein
MNYFNINAISALDSIDKTSQMDKCFSFLFESSYKTHSKAAVCNHETPPITIKASRFDRASDIAV